MSQPAAVTPIFDEVDRWWRAEEPHDSDDGTAAGTMLSFSGAGVSSPTVLSLLRAARSESGPRHALRR